MGLLAAPWSRYGGAAGLWCYEKKGVILFLDLWYAQVSKTVAVAAILKPLFRSTVTDSGSVA